MTQQDDFSIKMDQISYIESIKPVHVSKQQSMMRHEPLNKNELKQFRSVIGQLAGQLDRPGQILLSIAVNRAVQ